MAGLSLRFYCLLILATLPVFTWSINFGYRKFAEREEFDPRYVLEKRQTTSGSSDGVTDGQTCTAGQYLCPASVGGGCCPSGLVCGLTNCFASTTQASDTSSTNPTSPTTTTTSSTLSNESSSETSSSEASTGNAGSSTTTPTSTGASSGATTRAPSTTPSETSATFSIGETISAGNSIGVIGTDGVTRFCTVGSALCPASVNYGCCRTDASCGLTNCIPTTTVASAMTERTCSTGYLCASSLGYGCCPNGYSCGTASCYPSTTISGQAIITVTKTQNNFPFFETGKASDTSTTGIITSATSVPNGSHGPSGGAIGGIVGGILGGVILIGAAIGAYFFNKNRKARAASALQQPAMSQSAAGPGAGAAAIGGAGAGAYTKAQMAQGQTPSHDNRTSFGPSELGGDVPVKKPYGSQMAPVQEINPVAEAPGDSVHYPNHGQNPMAHQVFEVDGTSAIPRN